MGTQSITNRWNEVNRHVGARGGSAEQSDSVKEVQFQFLPPITVQGPHAHEGAQAKGQAENPYGVQIRRSLTNRRLHVLMNVELDPPVQIRNTLFEKSPLKVRAKGRQQ